jgi:hypothetical protein
MSKNKNIITREEAIRLGVIQPQPGEAKHARSKSSWQKRHEAFIRFLAGLRDCWLVLEYRFHPTRKWRFDVAIRGRWSDEARDRTLEGGYVLRPLQIAIEIDGGGWVHGRHHRPEGRRSDNEKQNAAHELGWQVYRFDWEQVQDGRALATIRGVLEREA